MPRGSECYCCQEPGDHKLCADTWRFCPDCSAKLDILCEQHDFSLERAAPALRRVFELAPTT